MRALTTMNDDPTEPFKSSPAELFGSLRISTCALLKYDPDNLSAEQTIRVDRAITLRLMIDHLQSRLMHGEQINVREFVEASEALERMVGGNPEAPAQQRFSGEHQKKLREIIAKTVLAPEPQEQVAARMWQDEAAAIAGAALPGAPVDLPPPPAIENEHTRSIVAEASPTPPPQRAETDSEWHARVNAKPSNPPPGLREAWRDHLGPDGSIVAPWFNPHG